MGNTYTNWHIHKYLSTAYEEYTNRRVGGSWVGTDRQHFLLAAEMLPALDLTINAEYLRIGLSHTCKRTPRPVLQRVQTWLWTKEGPSCWTTLDSNILHFPNMYQSISLPLVNYLTQPFSLFHWSMVFLIYNWRFSQLEAFLRFLFFVHLMLFFRRCRLRSEVSRNSTWCGNNASNTGN